MAAGYTARHNDLDYSIARLMTWKDETITFLRYYLNKIPGENGLKMKNIHFLWVEGAKCDK